MTVPSSACGPEVTKGLRARTRVEGPGVRCPCDPAGNGLPQCPQPALEVGWEELRGRGQAECAAVEPRAGLSLGCRTGPAAAGRWGAGSIARCIWCVFRCVGTDSRVLSAVWAGSRNHVAAVSSMHVVLSVRVSV